MPPTIKRIQEVHSFYEENGLDETIQELNISYQTLDRYLRRFRELMRKAEAQSKEPKERMPKVLVLDIETKPMKGFFWKVWNTMVPSISLCEDWIILTWSAKWLHSKEVFSGKITPEEVKNEDDARILGDLWNFVDEADVIITHNGIKFDMPKLNTRFLLNGFNPPSPYQNIDTYRVAKHKFSFTYNKLDFIGKILGLGGKLENGGMKLWLEAIEGNEESLDKMELYNKRDVTLLEEVYLRLRPWIPSHPNLSLFVDSTEQMCPVCTSTHVEELPHSSFATGAGKYTVFRCQDCGSIGRIRPTIVTKEKRKNLLISVAR